MNIKEEAQIMEEAGKYQDIIIFGKQSLVNILSRYFSKKQIAVKNVSYVGNQKRQGAFLGIPFDSMENMKDRAEQCLVFALANSHNPDQIALVDKKLKENGYKNVAYIDYDLMAQLGSKEHVRMDFICVGFVKCGTSSLHAALKKHKKIFLPKKKETLYMGWRARIADAPERFNKIYFNNIKEDQVVGNVEPSYHKDADGIFECYGKDTKILFMVRNPADAAYSYFKMLMRKTTSKKQVKYYRRYFRYNVKMFDDYIKDYLVTERNARFKYIDYIKKYEEYFGKENIKVIFFEEFIKNPEQIMNEVQDFIGVKPMKFSSLPHSNEGKEVSKNYIAALINRKIYCKDIALRSVYSQEEKDRHEKIKAFCHKHTLVSNNDKMDASSREFLNEFYKESIQELEKYCDKSLEGLWY